MSEKTYTSSKYIKVAVSYYVNWYVKVRDEKKMLNKV